MAESNEKFHENPDLYHWISSGENWKRADKSKKYMQQAVICLEHRRKKTKSICLLKSGIMFSSIVISLQVRYYSSGVMHYIERSATAYGGVCAAFSTTSIRWAVAVDLKGVSIATSPSLLSFQVNFFFQHMDKWQSNQCPLNVGLVGADCENRQPKYWKSYVCAK